jgi:hypothetical protein
MRRAVSLAVCLLSGPTFAQEGVRWRYVAPPECPSEQQFRDQVRARLLRDPGAREAAPSEGAPVSVEIRLEPSQQRAFLLLRGPGAPPIERVIEGNSCAELASGLALITALAFGATGEPPSATTPGPRGVAEPDAPTPMNTPVTPPAEPRPAGSMTAQPQGSPAPAQRLPSNSRRLGMEVGAGGWLNTWSAPGGALGADAFVRVGPDPLGGWSVRLAALYGFGASSVGGRRAEFRFFGARAEGCPISRGRPTFVGEACLALDVGSLRGKGDEASLLEQGASGAVLWAAAVIVGRLRARVGEHVSLEGQGELGVPLVRHEFVFEDPHEQVLVAPTLGVAAGLGLAVKFL